MNMNKVDVDKECPICGKEIRSDANVHEYCQLCGMGIPDPEIAPKMKNKDGEISYFCCEFCLAIFVNEIDKKD